MVETNVRLMSNAALANRDHQAQLDGQAKTAMLATQAMMETREHPDRMLSLLTC